MCHCCVWVCLCRSITVILAMALSCWVWTLARCERDPFLSQSPEPLPHSLSPMGLSACTQFHMLGTYPRLRQLHRDSHPTNTESQPGRPPPPAPAVGRPPCLAGKAPSSVPTSHLGARRAGRGVLRQARLLWLPPPSRSRSAPGPGGAEALR